jgi:hypothetical protein
MCIELIHRSGVVREAIANRLLDLQQQVIQMPACDYLTLQWRSYVSYAVQDADQF